MFQEPGDRGRLIVATVLTVVALPFLWSTKQENAGPESMAAITPGASVEVSGSATSEPLVGSMATAAPAFSAITAGGAPGTTLDEGIVTIDVAAPSGDNQATGVAQYRRWPNGLTDSEQPCGSAIAPFGERVVVTNTNNGYKVACTNVSSKPLPEGVVILLDTDVFLELADLGDSPIPVKISW